MVIVSLSASQVMVSVIGDLHLAAGSRLLPVVVERLGVDLLPAGNDGGYGEKRHQYRDELRQRAPSLHRGATLGLPDVGHMTGAPCGLSPIPQGLGASG